MSADIPTPPTPPRVLLARDIGYDSVRAAHRRGALLRIGRGAYLEVDSQGGPLEALRRRRQVALARCVAAAARLECDYAFSFGTAALLHGCWTWDLGGVPHITQTSRPSGRDSRGLRRHHSPLPADEVTVVNGLPVTTLERTIEDCARSLHPRNALAVADSGLRILVRPDRRRRGDSEARTTAIRRRLLSRLEDRPGTRGIVRARAVIEHADPLSESAGETDLRWLAVSRGLPRPICQLPIETGRGLFHADLGWLFDEAAGPGVLAVEYDGAQKYQPRPGVAPGALLRAEKQREDAIRESGAAVQRYVKEDFRDLDRLFARICRGFPDAVLARRRPVPGLQVLPTRHAAT